MDGSKMLFLPLLDLRAHSCARVYGAGGIRVIPSPCAVPFGVQIPALPEPFLVSASEMLLLVSASLLFPSLILRE